MTIANDIISCRMPDFDFYLSQGESLDDIDEYGFTPLIEAVLTKQIAIAEQLIAKGVDINKADVTGRTPLHWAIDNHDISLATLLLDHGANPNAYTHAGLAVLVYPLLRRQEALKRLLYQYGAQLDFALDFIQAKLLGHRYELTGDVDIVNPRGEFIVLEYEGFILEFTIAVLKDSVQRFAGNYAAKPYRPFFSSLHKIMDAMDLAAELLKLQHHPYLTEEDSQFIAEAVRQSLLVLPAASRGHAIGFVSYKQWWAKIDRGENSLKEGTVNIYQITKPAALNSDFLRDFLFKKQPRQYFHKTINQILGLQLVGKMPFSSQISGNCSWANIQAIVGVAYALLMLDEGPLDISNAMYLYEGWLDWDKDRALEECIQRFYSANSPLRKASFSAMLGAVLFQACDYENKADLSRAEKILPILNLPDYAYILNSYLEIYCVQRLTKRGNNLLKILDDCGINPNIGVSAIATGVKKKGKKMRE